MQEILDLLQRLPKPLKYIGIVFLLTPIIYVIAQLLGVPQYWWMFVLGVLAIAIVLSLFDVLLRRREKGQAKAFEGELRQDAQKGSASREEVRQALGDLAAKWSEAVTQLKQAGLDIYSLPWYLLIGEPQSGKSTTLKNSGLEFPVGADALSGAGGTRNCDWWFANEAVILDTAGRFTFQEENAPDQQEWGSFLRLLRKYRKFCPINGVLVVIPCTSLLEDSPEEQERKAQNIRQKLLSVQRVLQIRFPVFVMVTKADRILGFSEFFLKLDPVDQQQLFGWSNPEGVSKAYNTENFGGVYTDIVARLYKLRLRFLADEENPSHADKLYVFPEEFRALQTPLNHYLKTIFLQTRFDEPFSFRGFYFSSGVQQGRPIAQATRDLLAAPGGAAEGVLENLESIFKKSRAFFIRHFYEKKVFPEQGLIARTAAAEAQSRKTLWIVRILGVLVVLLFLGGMIPAYRSLQRVLNPIRRSVHEARDCVAKGGCSVPDSYRIASDIQHELDELSHKRWTFALFLRGTRSNELVTTLAAIQRKVYLNWVVAPLLAETEARMAQLDWAVYKDYRPFFEALKTELDWVAAKKPPASGAIVPLQDLKVLPLIDFCRRTRGMPGTPHAQEIDDWLKTLGPTDARPDEILGAAMRGAESVKIPVPDPERPIATFERYWTVENLARWDFTLMDGLAKYVALYGQMTTLPRSAPPVYLAQLVDVGRKFQANYAATTQHMATPRPGERGFPGSTLEQWKGFLRQDYQALLKWKPIAPGRISELRRDELLTRLDIDNATLVSRKSELAYLLDAAAAGKPAWSKPAAALASTLQELTNYADLTAYAATDDGKLLEKLAAMTAWNEKPKA
ncbi:MAG TPA: type VI secretion protein IcmF/TssM N-terminal domain-containing protein, partial [Thermoanaerobaculia bacterium]|nr:type VI secretion protein IcmF/TssM N-terminal domain-containing protein [Thermoanaerobaculia bacterium]